MDLMIHHLVSAIADLDEEATLEHAQTLLKMGYKSQELLNFSLTGLKIVGRKYEDGQYFIAALVMASELMRAIMDIIPPFGDELKGAGLVVLGTIEGDIHELGKDLVKRVLQSSGFTVRDLGVDVSPEIFLAEAIRHQPDVVGISILLSSGMAALVKSVKLLKSLIPVGQKKPLVIIGGGVVNQELFDKTGADIWSQDLMSLVETLNFHLNNRV